jgi:hypothetical protein
MIVILMETIKDLYQTRLAKDGGTVRTIRGGCDYMTGMGKQRELPAPLIFGRCTPRLPSQPDPSALHARPQCCDARDRDGLWQKIDLCEAPHPGAAHDVPKQSSAHHAEKGDTTCAR